MKDAELIERAELLECAERSVDLANRIEDALKTFSRDELEALIAEIEFWTGDKPQRGHVPDFETRRPAQRVTRRRAARGRTKLRRR